MFSNYTIIKNFYIIFNYSISNNKSLTIREVARLFNSKIKYLPPRKGERYASALSGMSLNNKVYKNNPIYIIEKNLVRIYY